MSSNGSSGRWEAQFRKGCLELAILTTLLEGRLYGLEILRKLGENPKMVLAEGTLYPILSRLKKDRLVESEWVEAETGHPRKYYWLTRAGRIRVREMSAFWGEFSSGLDSMLRAKR